MKKYTFWIAIVALMLSLCLIAVICMDVWEISVIDSNSFISGLVAIMSIIFTLLVGYQIYNALDLKEKIAEIDRLKIVLQETKNDLLREIQGVRKEKNQLKQEFIEGIYIIQARMHALKVTEKHGAFLKMLLAIQHALDVNHTEDGYGWMLKELKEYMLMINNSYPFSGSSEQIKAQVDEYRGFYKETDAAIKRHCDYYIIRDEYERLMMAFEKRLDGIAQMKAMSSTNVGEEMKTE